MKAVLERTFGAWLDLSKDEEVLALLDLVREALERRGFLVAVATRKVPPTKEGAA